MAYNAPTYITRGKHGVYYFQIRNSSVRQRFLGTKSKHYRKSLRTKDRYLAIRLARRMWVNYNHTSLLGISMSNKNDLSGDVAKWLDKEDLLINEERDKSRFIKIAISFEDRHNAIPEWDFESRENLFEHITQEEEIALRYVTDNKINLDDYRKIPVTETTNSDASNLIPITLNDSLEKYLDVKRTNNVVDKSLRSYTDNISLFIEIINIEDANAVTQEHIDIYISSIQKIPTNRKKIRGFRDKTLQQILNMEIDESKLLSDSTKSSHTTNVKSFLDWAIKKRYIAKEVSSPLEDVFKNPKSYPYIAFSNDDLTCLFNSEEYVKGTHKSASHYWVPLIGLYTGCRSNEICQLYVSDIKNHSIANSKKVIPYFDINNEDEKTLKTDASKRIIPIHSVLIDLGFLEFVENQRLKDHTRIFDDLSKKSGKFNDGFSRWFNSVYRPSCGVQSLKPDKRKVFHSFRHTLTQNIRHNDEKVPLEKIAEIIGHISNTTIGRHYAGVLDITDKLVLIEKASYKFDVKNIRKWRLR